MSTSSSAYQNVTLLGVRLVVASIFLWHGVPKAIDPAAGFEKFVSFGLPGFLGPIVGVVETVAAILLITGVVHRSAALALAAIIIGALITVQIPGGVHPGLERDLLILASTLLLAAHEPGRCRLRIESCDAGGRRADAGAEAPVWREPAEPPRGKGGVKGRKDGRTEGWKVVAAADGHEAEDNTGSQWTAPEHQTHFRGS